MKRGIFVLGMHRSGTSAATRLVNLLGVPICVEEDLLPPTPDNPRGYWESASLTAFNDRLLASLGGDWSCPVPLETGWEGADALERLRTDASDLFPRVFTTDEWVWKDPRNCIAFPFWAQLVDARPVVVLVHRSPLEVAASLGARDHFRKPHGLALWERYLRECLAGIAGAPTLVTDYADLVADPLEWCRQVREFLSAAGVSTTVSPEAEVLDFVDGQLWRSRFGADELAADPDLSRPQRDLLAALEDLRGAHASFAAPALEPETPSTEELLAERRHAYSRRLALRSTY